MENRARSPVRLAIVVSHPIQYYAPWFAYLEMHLKAQVRVFYLWDFGVRPQFDPGFNCELAWDVELLAGYDYHFVPNESADPGTHHFRGLDNPRLTDELVAWGLDAVLLFGYRFKSHLQILMSRRLREVPFIFRGDSHLLAQRGQRVQRAMKRFWRRLLFRRFSAALTVGKANRAYLRQNGFTEERIFFAPHAVDNRRFTLEQNSSLEEAKKWKRELQIPEQHQVILFAGKFERKKMTTELVRSFVKAKLSNTTLLLVGGGALERELRRLSRDSADIRFAPFQNQQAMPRTYLAADVVVLPSFGPDETWGLAINEAMCCGKAVVVSDHVGCHADLVQDGWNGLVFRAGSQAALIAALREALRDPARLKRWGEEGRKMIDAHSYQAATHGLEAALTAVLAQRSVK